MQITSELSPEPVADGRLVVVRVAGEIDYTNSGEMAGEIWNVLARHSPAAIRVDLAEASFIDSTGLGALVGGYRAAAEAGCAFTVAAPSPAFRRVLTITGLTDLFGVEDERSGPQRTVER
ncbi:STAS domain-containing protein [Catenuloplanes atrovinosus]|uniref:Anti-sigma factor antagonist n=1 Tax=Catenuloplanes atrovinosus TaxID=137266 RepID=A0AAE4CCW2_9ACTN|nr:STAS domain-containing protein [Catenuloplanes atrovinosus]MDR7279672.1 anti-sigma B factor antagonist [Catenuloplanes atrovinosus]